MIAETTTQHAIHPIGGGTATRCTFCKRTIAEGESHVHVAEIGPMCIRCRDITTTTVQAGRRYVTITRRSR